ncbi:hypothetical protein [Spiribacter vilamensis]|uniref:GNAT family N-acetyltransferase n=1 Tax=Spiribacter vilamensis TaxID=531306 RepID=A0A4Q8D1K6_9GAMM|nr:hypothetical protein [Spiribacter vilamensis]RZU99192.1 hypothetical protein EV698_1473 [Spiribacter vilamensis]TVO61820.1 hypothetical protein FPL09_06845 [Spiribacter vilamensis]
MSSRISAHGFSPIPRPIHPSPNRPVSDLFRLVPATPDWVEEDFAAVVESRPAIRGLFGPEVDWPPFDLTIQEDRDDLRWHADEFEEGTSFAFLVIAPRQRLCNGCLYLFPTQSPDHDIEAYLWIRSDLDGVIAKPMEEQIIAWVTDAWPFQHVAWPGRDCAIEDWYQRGYANYYSRLRD